MAGIFFAGAVIALVRTWSTGGVPSRLLLSLSLFMAGFSLWSGWAPWQGIALFYTLLLVLFLPLFLYRLIRKRKKRRAEKREISASS